MSKDVLRKAHAEFETAVMPIGVSAIQRQEMKRAFYAGAYALLVRQMTIVADPETSEAEGIDYLKGVLHECQAFFDEIAKGKA
jgi:hypothetical protein